MNDIESTFVTELLAASGRRIAVVAGPNESEIQSWAVGVRLNAAYTIADQLQASRALFDTYVQENSGVLC